MDFNGKTAVITGAAKGIGRAVALQMAQSGARVALLDLEQEQLTATQKEVLDLGAEAIALVCDVSDENALNRAIQQVFSAFGKVDILINNAALWRNYESFLDFSVENWKTFLDINVMGAVYCTRAVLPKMIENGYGRIVNVASVAGVYGNANMTAYSATKGALISMTKALAKEVVEKGVIVNSVSPGTVSPSRELDVNHVQDTAMCYSKRTGSDAENADLICYLASEKNGYIIGQNIQIDGGRKEI